MSDKGLWWSRLLVGEFVHDLAGELLLSSAQLEQARPQPQHKGSPSTVGLSLGSLVASCRLKVHVLGCSASRLLGRNGIVFRAREADLFILAAQARGGVLVRVGGTDVVMARDMGDSIAGNARCANTSLATVLCETVGISVLCALLFTDLLAGIFLFLGLFLLLKLASRLTDVLLTSSSVDLTPRSKAETTHVQR